MKRLFIIIAFLTSQVNLFTQVIETRTIVGTDFKPGHTVTLEDLNATNYAFTTHESWLSFEYLDHINHFFQNKDFKVTVELEIREGTNLPITPYPTLELTHHSNPIFNNTFKTFFKIGNNKKVQVKIKSITTNYPNYTNQPIFRLNVYLKRNPIFVYQANPTIQFLPPPSNVSASHVDINWTPTVLCDEFDFEWAYIDEKSELYTSYQSELLGNSAPTATLTKQLTFSRLTTSVPFINKLPLIYRKGVVIYRIRAVYYDMFKNRKTSDWIEANSSGNRMAFLVSGVEKNKNWTASIDLVEEGKHKELITFYDGIQRDRQMVTYDNSSQKPIITETIYDKEGRKAVYILPAPSFESNGLIKYYSNFNLNQSTQLPYSENDLKFSTHCGQLPDKLHVSNGAARYYSESNPEKNNLHHSFIPDAKGYPIASVEYRNENTGRITRQGGLGETFQIGNNKETKFLYSEATRNEINRLFGTDVGFDGHFFKNATIDPNGQASVAYKDMSGKTIATSLAGIAGQAHIEPLTSSRTDALSDTILYPDKFKPRYSEASSIATTSMMVTGNQYVKFVVGLDSPHLEMNCKRKTCSDCYYNFDVKVEGDRCSNIKKEEHYKNYADLNKLDTVCDNRLPSIRDSFELFMPVGDYTVSAKISVPEKVIDFYTKRYLDSSTCLISLDSLIRKHVNAIKPWSCIKNCDSCKKYFKGSGRTAYINSLKEEVIKSGRPLDQITLDAITRSADSAGKFCDRLCSPTSSCDILYSTLLGDVKPGGQYAYWFDKVKNKFVQDTILYRPSYMLQTTSVINTWYLAYLNIRKKDGSAYEIPKDLEEFNKDWKEEWAHELVKMHPEYCAYTYCLANNRDAFIEELQGTETIESAINKGFFDFASTDKGLKDLLSNANKFSLPFKSSNVGDPDKIGDNIYGKLTHIELKDTTWTSVTAVLNIYSYSVLLSNVKLMSISTGMIDVDTAKFRQYGCKGLKDAFWQIYRDNIIHNFRKMYDQNLFARKSYWSAYVPPLKDPNVTGEWVIESYGCPDDRLHLGQCLDSNDKQNMAWYQDTSVNLDPNTYPYCRKKPRVYNTSQIENYFNSKLYGKKPYELGGDGDVEFKAGCQKTCEDMAAGWLNTLKDCPPNPTVVNQVQWLKDFKQALIAICKMGCDAEHPMGASTTPNNQSILYKGVHCKSFQDVLNVYRGSSINPSHLSCYADFIDIPKPYYTKMYTETEATNLRIQKCVCDNLKERGKEYINKKGIGYYQVISLWTGDPYNVPVNPPTKLVLRQGFIDYLRETYPEDSNELTKENLQAIYDNCNNKDTLCEYLDQPVLIPRQLDCYNKITCKQYQYGKLSFKAKYPNAIERTYTHNKLMAGHINNLYGMNLSYYDYIAFEKKCKPCEEPCDNMQVETDTIIRKKGKCSGEGSGSGTGGDPHGDGTGNGGTDAVSAPPVPSYDMTPSYMALSPEQKEQILTTLSVISKSEKFALPPSNYEYQVTNSESFPVYSSFSNDYELFPFPFPCGEEGSIQVDEEGNCYMCLGWEDPVAGVCYPPGMRPFPCPNCIPYRVYFDPEFCDSIKRTKGKQSCDTCIKRIIYKCGDENTGITRDTVEFYLSDEECNGKPPKLVDTIKSGGGSGGTGVGGTGGTGGGGTGSVGSGGPIGAIAPPSPDNPVSSSQPLFYTINPNNRESALKKLYGEENFLLAKTILHELDSLQELYSLNSFETPPTPPPTPPGGGSDPIPDTCNYILFDKPLSPRVKIKNSCVEQQINLAISSAMYEWEKQRESAIAGFRQRYIEKCLDDANGRVVKRAAINEHHFTLYYYGQDGNLLRTVPPKGFNPIPVADLDQVHIDKRFSVHNPAIHTLATDYKYNSLNQVYEQTTPDAGTTKFVYDELGRIILSQNEEQRARSIGNTRVYSYSLYDKFGRVDESGEIDFDKTKVNGYDLDVFFAVTSNFLKYGDFVVVINQLRNTVLTGIKFRYVTKTYYEKYNFIDVQAEFGGIQENLKNRIASVTLDTLDTDRGNNRNNFQSAIHYSYDVLGNVKTMVTESKMTLYANQRFKHLEYDYDLASGKVNKLTYQKGETDQFFYRYEYDAENKLTKAYTSTNGLEWERDANYSYYTHGPLARTVIGEREVQGVDYAYNLQGWLKSINSDVLNTQRDMGRDGHSSGSQQNTARDAVAMTLNYFQGDYQQIGRTTDPIFGVTHASLTNAPLFNGNISSIIASNKGLSTPTMGYKYSYDQLHRLVKMDAFTNAQTPTNDYKERIAYDANGNILTYLRNKDNAEAMDDLKYKYYYYPNGSINPVTYDPLNPPIFVPGDRITNQLAQVSDAIGANVHSSDIDPGQNPNNYLYDAIGNLIEDKIEQLKISWTPAGKIANIRDNKKNQLISFAYDPLGIRIAKIVSSTNNSKPTVYTYYTRDAQGNSLAVYNNHYQDVEDNVCTINQADLGLVFNRIQMELNSCNPSLSFYQCWGNLIQQYPVLFPTQDSCLIKAYEIIFSTKPPCVLNLSLHGLVQQFYNDFNATYISLPVADQEALIITETDNYSGMYGIAPSDLECFRNKVRASVGLNSSDFNDYFIDLTSGNQLRNWEMETRQTIANATIKYNKYIDAVSPTKLYWQEQHLYGSSRLGMALPQFDVTATATSITDRYKKWQVGRQYELSNHLGNVLATIKDEKTQIEATTPGTIDYYEPTIVTATDNYPFGMPMPKRIYSLSSGSKYRFGFNGQEKDDEVYGEGNFIAFESRIFDSRIGRFLSCDPKESEYAWQSTYAFFSNNPIFNIDYKGEGGEVSSEVVEAAALRYQEASKKLNELLRVMEELKKIIDYNQKVIDEHTAWGIGTTISSKNPIVGFLFFLDQLKVESKFEEQLKMYDDLADKFKTIHGEYLEAKQNLKGTLQTASAITLGGVILTKQNQNGSTNKNSNTSKSNCAIYEFEIDGTHYKFGLAEADRKTKQDVRVQKPNGSYETIPKGTPVRIYQQQRAMLQQHNDVKVTYEVHNNTYKYVMKERETTKILNKARLNGNIVGDGNTAHAKKYGLNQKGKLPKKFK